MFNNNKQRQFFVGAEKVNDLEISRKLLTDIAVLLNVISEGNDDAKDGGRGERDASERGLRLVFVPDLYTP